MLAVAIKSEKVLPQLSTANVGLYGVQRQRVFQEFYVKLFCYGLSVPGFSDAWSLSLTRSFRVLE